VDCLDSESSKTSPATLKPFEPLYAVDFLPVFLRKLEFDSSGKVSPEVRVENLIAAETLSLRLSWRLQASFALRHQTCRAAFGTWRRARLQTGN
jgi:hypothetical protein